MRSVVAHAGAGRLQLGDRVAGDDAIELAVAERAAERALGPDEQLGAGARTVDHRRQGDGLVAPDAVAEALVERGAHGFGVGHRTYQSSGSMNRWMVPPQVSPTANASSSE